MPICECECECLCPDDGFCSKTCHYDDFHFFFCLLLSMVFAQFSSVRSQCTLVWIFSIYPNCIHSVFRRDCCSNLFRLYNVYWPARRVKPNHSDCRALRGFIVLTVASHSFLLIYFVSIYVMCVCAFDSIRCLCMVHKWPCSNSHHKPYENVWYFQDQLSVANRIEQDGSIKKGEAMFARFIIGNRT